MAAKSRPRPAEDRHGAAKGRTVPLAATMAEKLEALRKWAHGRARLAKSATGGQAGGNARKLAVMPGRN